MKESEIKNKEIHIHARSDADLAMPDIIVARAPSSAAVAGSLRHIRNTLFRPQATRSAHPNILSVSRHGADS